MKRAWLADVPRKVVVATNRMLCAPAKAFHGHTSDGYEEARKLWERQHLLETDVMAAVELCRRCHRIAPFCNYNGNTFVAIMRLKIGNLDFPAEAIVALKSLAGHVIAGTATPEEERLLLETIDQLFPADTP